MPSFLRKIKEGRWNATQSWVPANDIPSDPLGDLQTGAGLLSVWSIEDDRSNLERVVTALAVKSQSVANFDYTLFDPEMLRAPDIRWEKHTGGTADVEANEAWHYDLYLTARLSLELAVILYTNGERDRIGKQRLLSLIRQGYNAGQLRRDLMDKELARKHFPIL